MKHSIVTFECDGPDCTLTTGGTEYFPPTDWFTVMPPDCVDSDWSDRHFCSMLCLSMWAAAGALAPTDHEM